MIDIEQIGIEFETAGLEKGTRALKEAEGAAHKTADAADKVGAGAKRAGAGMDVAAQAAKSLAAAMSLNAMSNAVETWQNLNSQLAIATGSIKAGAAAYAEVSAIAARTGQSIEGIGAVYQKLAQSAAQIGISQKQVATTSETVAKAMALSGASASSAQAAITQFGQALSSGALRGDELNSILEQSPRLARALADGLGVPIGKLKELGEQGKITSEALVDALSNQSGKLTKEFEQMPVTMSRALQSLKNEWVNTMGTFESSTGAFGTAAKGVEAIAKNMDTLALAGTVVAAVYGGKMVSSIVAATSAKVADTVATINQTRATQAAAIAAQQYTGLMMSQSVATAAAASSVAGSATAVATASGLARGAMAALGGPIGLVTTALTLGAAAWTIWGNKTEQATETAAKSAIQNLDSVIAKIEEMNGRLDQINRKAYDNTMKSAESEAKTVAAQIGMLKTQLDTMDTAGGRGRFSQEGRAKQAELNALAEREILLQAQLGKARADSAKVGTDALVKFIDANATGADKVRVAQQKMLSEFATAIQNTGGVFDSSNKMHVAALSALNAGLDDAAKGAKKLSNEYASLTKSLQEKLIASQAELANAGSLTDAQKLHLDTEAKIAELLKQNPRLNAEKARAILASVEATMAEVEAMRAAAEALKEYLQWIGKLADDEAGRSKAMQQANEKLREEIDLLGLSELQQAEYKNAKLATAAASDLVAAAEYDAMAAMEEATGVCNAASAAYRDLAISKRASANAAAESILLTNERAMKTTAVKAASDSSRAWQKFADDIERSLTDALYRSFESGDGFGKSFAKNLENTFKSMVLKFAIQTATTTGGNLVNSGLNYIFGTSAANNGTGSNYLGLANDANSIYNAGSAIASTYTALTTGAGALPGTLSAANAWGAAGNDSLGALINLNPQWGMSGPTDSIASSAASAATAESASGSTLTASTIASAIGAGLTAYGAAGYLDQKYGDAAGVVGGTLAGAGAYAAGAGAAALMSGAGAAGAMTAASAALVAIPVWGWAALAIMAIAGSSGKGQWEMDGVPRLVGSFNEANEGMTSGTTLQDFKRDGGWFSSDETKTEGQKITDAFDSVLDRMYKGIKGSYVQIGKLFDDNDLADKLVGFGMRVEIGNIANTQEAMQSMAQQLGDAMGRVLFPSIAAMQTSGEAWAATFQRVVNEVDAVNRVFSTLGTTLAEQFGKNNVDKVLRLSDSLVTLFGGVDAMLASVQTYYAGYYSKPEQADQQRAIMAAQFEALGVAMPETRTQFRRLVESMDLTSSAGQKTYVSLINMSAAFGTWADSLASTVDEVASQIEQALSGLFDGLRQKISGARQGVASARSSITDIGLMTPAQIGAAIAGAVPALPGNNLVATQAALEQAKASSSAAINAAIAARDAEQAAVNERNKGWAYKVADLPMIGGWAFNGGGQVSEYNNIVSASQSAGVLASSNLAYSDYRNSAASFGLANGYQFFLDGSPIGQNLALNHWQDGVSANGQSWGRYTRDLDVYAYKPYGTEAINPIFDQNIAAAKAAGATSINAAEKAATQAQIDYSKAIRQYVVDAGKAVEKLNDLRDETVEYYTSQQELSLLLLVSANNLRDAIKIARQSQLSDSAWQSQAAGDFNRAYTLALSTTGSVQAGYADQMSGMLPGLVSSLEKTAVTQYDWVRASTVFYAQSNAIASAMEGQAAVDYQAESLGLLSAIDAALTSIEANASSAEKIISDAVYETGATNAEGLRAVIAAISGKPIPAFASGGYHAGGWRIVGENGPEAEYTGPSRIFNASQTKAMFSGGANMDQVVGEIRAMRDENRAQASAIVQLNARLLKLHERWEGNGMPETRVTA